VPHAVPNNKATEGAGVTVELGAAALSDSVIGTPL
jgi:hypothetical protein